MTLSGPGENSRPAVRIATNAEAQATTVNATAVTTIRVGRAATSVAMVSRGSSCNVPPAIG